MRDADGIVCLHSEGVTGVHLRVDVGYYPGHRRFYAVRIELDSNFYIIYPYSLLGRVLQVMLLSH